MFTASRPAAAQSLTLNSGNNVTVSGAGTIGTIGGQPVANTTTPYTANGGADDSPAVQTNGTATFTLGAGGSLASTTGDALEMGYESSGDVTITGGTFAGSTLSGAVIELGISGSGDVAVSGGAFIAQTALFANDGDVTISGGTFAGSGAQSEGLDTGNPLTTITGGTFTAGAGGYGLRADSYSTIDLFGTGFSYTVDGQTTLITSGDLPSNATYPGVVGTLSGTLLDGQALNDTTFSNSGTIEINAGAAPALPTATPEPSQSAALGLGVLGYPRWRCAPADALAPEHPTGSPGQSFPCEALAEAIQALSPRGKPA